MLQICLLTCFVKIKFSGKFYIFSNIMVKTNVDPGLEVTKQFWYNHILFQLGEIHIQIYTSFRM